MILIKSLMNRIVFTMNTAMNAAGKKCVSQLRSNSDMPVKKSSRPRMRIRIMVDFV